MSSVKPIPMRLRHSPKSRFSSANGDVSNTYDAAKQTWKMKWLNALAGTWIDLGPEELGGVHFDRGSIVYVFKEPVAAHAYTRATYTNISEAHFTWRGEKSEDWNTWSEFMVVEAYRSME
ncbi:MAG: hypothetical protein JO138_23880 [Acidobacteriaceae bacterium]|nr:hypothetical protein [Acidobacteriaceae bacterium]